MMMRFLVVIAALCMPLAESFAANVPLQQAQKKYKELDYQAMPGLLAEALLQPGLTTEDYVEIYRLQGFTYTVLGDSAKAREAFIKLLVIDPEHKLGNVSPRFRGAFEETRKDFDAKGAVTIQHTPPTLAGPSDGVETEFRLHDEFGRIQGATAKVRAVVYGKEGGFVEVQLVSAGPPRGDRVFKGRLPDPTASIPGDRPTGYLLEYQAAFTNPVGAPVAVQGAPPSWRITVGDPSAAPPPANNAQSSTGNAGQVAQDEPGPSKLPIILGAVAGVAVVGFLGLLVVGGAGTAAVGGGAACYALGPCNPAPRPTYAKVHVVVER